MNKEKNVIDRIRTSKRLRRSLGIIGISIISLIVAVIISIVVLRESGKKSLYAAGEKQSMSFGQTENDGERTNNIVQAGDEDEYDILYNGEKYKYNDGILTFLVLGIDKDEKVTPAKDGVSGGQSDGIFLLVMNPDRKKIDVITVHRDTVVKLWIYDEKGNFVKNAVAQICLQHGYGDGMELSNERAKEAVSTLFYGLPIHSVTSVNMGLLRRLMML